MQSIVTKYLSPGNVRGARIKATCERGSITIPYPHELSGWRCHEAAAKALVAKFIKEDAQDGKYSTPPEKNPWGRPMVCGALPGAGYVFCWPEIGSNQAVIEFANEEDADAFKRYFADTKATDGTVTGLRAGVMCSALKRARM